MKVHVGKKEADWTWRQKQPSVLIPPPDPVSLAVLYSLPDKAWQYNPLLPKEFKILQVDVMSQLKKILIFMFNTVLFKIPAVSMLSGSAYRYMHKLLNI